MATIRVNRLPVPTFRYLHVNDAEADPGDLRPAAPDVTVPDGAELHQTAAAFPEQTALTEALRAAGTPCTEITGNAGAPVRVTLSENGSAAFSVRAERGAVLRVIQVITAAQSAHQTVISADADAQVKLTRVFLGADAVCGLHVSLADRSLLTLTDVCLGSGKTVSGIRVQMNGKDAQMHAAVGYLLGGSAKLDLNLHAVHSGRRSESDIDVRGVLRDTAQKIFRGTIDFMQGASGAKGREREDVLLMHPGVVNRTVPVILCAEEDVEGEHGASVGQLDPQQVFYMQSRGIPQEKIGGIIAQSRLSGILRSIGDAETEKLVRRALGEEVQEDA